MGYHATSFKRPEGQIEYFAKHSGLNERHAEMVIEESLQIGDNIPVYIKNSDAERYEIENGEMTFFLHNK